MKSVSLKPHSECFVGWSVLFFFFFALAEFGHCSAVNNINVANKRF